MSWVLGLKDYLGLGIVAVLAGLLAMTAVKADHWHDTAVSNANLYHAEQAAHRQTVANYLAAANQAEQADAANVVRVKAQQAAINERSQNEYQARVADARARADSLRAQPGTSANPGSFSAAGVPGPGSAPGSATGPTSQDGLSVADRLLATEQAIQLDELIKWVRANVTVDYSNSSQSSPSGSR